MLVLGLNFGNDASAAIVSDGEVLGASQEERFTRVKHDVRFPEAAIRFCLQRAGARIEDCDAVAFFWNPGIHAQAFNARMSTRPRHHLEYLYNVPNHLLRGVPGDEVTGVEQIVRLRSGSRLHIHYVTHHLCHAASALFRSPFDEAALLTVDGYGERTATHMAAGRGLDIESVHEIEFPHSIGSVYAAVTEYLGFRANSGEGKVMGLAAYGKPTYLPALRELVPLTPDGFRVDLQYFSYYLERERRVSDLFLDRFGPPRLPESALDARHFDMAASLQALTEEVMVHLARVARQKTGLRHLGVAGGVALNCMANARIAREAGFDDCFFQPAAGDAGTALGAALWVTHGVHRVPRRSTEIVDTLGPEYTDAEISAELTKAAIPSVAVGDRGPEAAAALLASGRIVGWFQGRAEFGPRALGNRSILADPRRADMKDILNRRVKFREGFRPFAPSVLAEEAGTLFTPDVMSPFMLQALQTRADKRDVVPAVTHEDGTARIQTVTRSANPRFHQLIVAFRALTAVPCVLNTSLNVRGEPIVHSVADAIKCFYTTDMDAMFIGGFALARGADVESLLRGFAASAGDRPSA
ncbi:MAG: carbamoyltransferase C-terminal domain-containing protein [Vicinamibacterales bacterium]